MKKLTLLCLLLLVFVAASTCSAQQVTWPYVLTGTPMTCGPVANCFNSLYLPAGWYGSIAEGGAARCFQALPWAQGYGLNVLVQIWEQCARTNTLLEAYMYNTSQWNYAPGNPYAVNNVIWAAAIGGTGAVYAIVNNNSYLLGSEYLVQDCYTGNEFQSGGNGGSC